MDTPSQREGQCPGHPETGRGGRGPREPACFAPRTRPATSAGLLNFLFSWEQVFYVQENAAFEQPGLVTDRVCRTSCPGSTQPGGLAQRTRPRLRVDSDLPALRPALARHPRVRALRGPGATVRSPWAERTCPPGCGYLKPGKSVKEDVQT